MKKIGFSIVVAVVVLGSLATTAAAQDRVLARVSIPFNFNAHGQQLNAGAYELRQIGANTVRLQQVATRKGITLLSPQNVALSDTTDIVFHRYGGHQFLAAVVSPSYQISVPKSPVEKEIAAASRMTTVALAAKH